MTPEKNRRWRCRKLAEGCCVNCGKPRGKDGTRQFCGPCKVKRAPAAREYAKRNPEKKAAYLRAYRARRKAEGCPLKQSRGPRKPRTEAEREVHRLRAAERRRMEKASSGLTSETIAKRLENGWPLHLAETAPLRTQLVTLFHKRFGVPTKQIRDMIKSATWAEVEAEFVDAERIKEEFANELSEHHQIEARIDVKLGKVSRATVGRRKDDVAPPEPKRKRPPAVSREERLMRQAANQRKCSKRKRLEADRLGLCVRFCGRLRREGHTECAECNAKSRAWWQKRRDAQKREVADAGLTRRGKELAVLFACAAQREDLRAAGLDRIADAIDALLSSTAAVVPRCPITKKVKPQDHETQVSAWLRSLSPEDRAFYEATQ